MAVKEKQMWSVVGSMLLCAILAVLLATQVFAVEQGRIDYTNQFDPDAPANHGKVQEFVNAVLT